MPLQNAIARAISQATGQRFPIDDRREVGGGCINRTEILQGGDRSYFVKLNDAVRLDMFEAESEGLIEIADTQSVRVPHPICLGTHAGQAYLVLEYLDIGHAAGKSDPQGRGSVPHMDVQMPRAQDARERLAGGTSAGMREVEQRREQLPRMPAATDELLGQQLAAMHRTTTNEFGWRRNNTIGSTPQINIGEQDWVMFYREQRLRFQLDLANEHGYGGDLLRHGELLLEKLPVFFASYQPVPSLLHGDLWGGNHAVLHDDTPVIFDPAVYYGDREADLAMTELFGGFGSGFYAAYREAWPLDPGYRIRRDLYNLYHVLNHLNLFGGGYRGQAEQLIDRLLSET